MPFPTFDTQDAIPESFRSEYAEKDGKWIPKAIIDDQGIKENHRKVLDEKKKADAEIARLKGLFGEHKPEEIEEILKGHRAAEEERQKKAGDFDKLLAKRVNEKEAELLPKVKEGEDAIRELKDLKFDHAVRRIASDAGIPEKNHRAVIALTKAGSLKLEDGKLVVLDTAGDPRSITAEKFFAEEFKTDYPELYAASGASGSGATGASNRGGGNNGGAISITDQAAFLQHLDNIADGKVHVRT